MVRWFTLFFCTRSFEQDRYDSRYSQSRPTLGLYLWNIMKICYFNGRTRMQIVWARSSFMLTTFLSLTMWIRIVLLWKVWFQQRGWGRTLASPRVPVAWKLRYERTLLSLLPHIFRDSATAIIKAATYQGEKRAVLQKGSSLDWFLKGLKGRDSHHSPECRSDSNRDTFHNELPGRPLKCWPLVPVRAHVDAGWQGARTRQGAWRSYGYISWRQSHTVRSCGKFLTLRDWLGNSQKLLHFVAQVKST